MDRPRSGAPWKITDEQVETLVARTLGQAPPTDDSHWSTRSMAEAAGMSQSAVSRIWRAFGLKQHIVETWKLSTDPQFVTKVRDVVGMYLSPPENALVLAVDEKSQIQALDRMRHPCFHLHFTPTSASWLNLIERWFAELMPQTPPLSPPKRRRTVSIELARGFPADPKPTWHGLVASIAQSTW